MSKYYLKHTNASGYSEYSPVNLIGVIGYVANLFTGESITIVRRGGELEQKLRSHPALWEKL